MLLKEISFPLDFKICVDPSMNQTAFREYGYKNDVEYIIGSGVRSNFSLIGWGGHGHDGKSLTKPEVIFKAVKLNLTEDILDGTMITTSEGDMIWRDLFVADLIKINHPFWSFIFSSISFIVDKPIFWSPIL